jgi:hypothetical protein
LAAVETCPEGTGSNISPACFVDQLRKVEEGECILKDPKASLFGFGTNASMEEAFSLDVNCDTGFWEMLGETADPRCNEWLRQKSLAENETKIDFINEVLNKSASLSPYSALAVIISESGWTGTILDSGFDMRSIAGYGNQIREFQCNEGSYGVTIQKDTEYGTLSVLVIQGGKVMDNDATGASYGLVSLSGKCGSIGAPMDILTQAVQAGKID